MFPRRFPLHSDIGVFHEPESEEGFPLFLVPDVALPCGKSVCLAVFQNPCIPSEPPTFAFRSDLKAHLGLVRLFPRLSLAISNSIRINWCISEFPKPTFLTDRIDDFAQDRQLANDVRSHA
ncbi:Set1C PHD Finger protein [Pseudozyma hubeiensis SY62]|uniref:Set1C PHD Finger protein n=1 Tax=Pseudozyma hubeiensis (strain SY62) TaxID=1305764 RepID=R9P2U7_PSEHS|nr:Set1C PHD Finger protein [Pseudozyma hubeiensis SY62]GAC95619.1 Set1C PHD Finger protein [Pseudozyma hubeiensis SY62]